MIYIQKADGLLAISSQLTKEKIIAALGYTPADNTTFWEDESGGLVIADENGYIIARIDVQGLETTKVSAKAIQLNGEDLAEKLKTLEGKTVDLTSYATKKYVDDAIANIDTSDIDLSQYALDADVKANKTVVDTHINNENIHVTAEEKETWNSKSDFSGNYSDLNNAPNIATNEEQGLVICDPSGNIIMQVDANGLNVADVYINGKHLKKENSLANKKISILGDSISTYSGYLPSGYAAYYPKGDVTDVSQTWWKILIDDNNMILGQNASWSGSTIQSNSNGFFLDSRITALGANGDPDIIIIQGGTNDGALEDISELGELKTNLTIPLTSTAYSDLDPTTFLGAYQTLIIKLMLAYPNAKIACWSIPWSSSLTVEETYKASMKIKELCDLYGCEFLDIHKCGINLVNLGSYMGAGDSTYTHPNSAGMKLIADYIGEHLK